MQTLSQHLNIASIDIEDFLLSTIMLSLELAKFYTQDCAWGVAHSIPHLVHAANLKAVITFFSAVLDMPTSGILTFLAICTRILFKELLHRKVTATDEDNETMFCHVQEFIVKSKRFL